MNDVVAAMLVLRRRAEDFAYDNLRQCCQEIVTGSKAVQTKEGSAMSQLAELCKPLTTGSSLTLAQRIVTDMAVRVIAEDK